ncbi:hypothetical protein L1887_55977 [Cichorium endivia]|nr:hypothetical protein L1887_55977 [Cichorium endivia]
MVRCEAAKERAAGWTEWATGRARFNGSVMHGRFYLYGDSGSKARLVCARLAGIGNGRAGAQRARRKCKPRATSDADMRTDCLSTHVHLRTRGSKREQWTCNNAIGRPRCFEAECAKLRRRCRLQQCRVSGRQRQDHPEPWHCSSN